MFDVKIKINHSDLNLIEFMLEVFMPHWLRTVGSLFSESLRYCNVIGKWSGRIEQSVVRLTQKPDVPGSIPGPATYFRFFFRLFKKSSFHLLALGTG